MKEVSYVLDLLGVYVLICYFLLICLSTQQFQDLPFFLILGTTDYRLKDGGVILPKVAPLLYNNGGPIIMVQVCKIIIFSISF